MKIRGKRRQCQRGITFIEILVAGAILSIGVLALVKLWFFSFTITQGNDERSVAYNLGRQTMERVKQAGFYGQPEGDPGTPISYDGDQRTPPVGTTCYTVTTSVRSSACKTGSPGTSGSTPDDTALRTVRVTVKRTRDNTVVYDTSTYLVRAGI